MLNEYFVVGTEEVFIKLNEDCWTIIDFEDFDKANSLSGTWSSYQPSPTSKTYYVIAFTTRTIRLHRRLMKLKRSDLREVDHKDRNGLNNRKYNLRVVSVSVNNH